ncbi:hypothetical protein SKAU_G00285770 [Synaphobranchus kaupii]|uniref:Uncharacterized protein n=1 Tax=Synaphobranchus kaupii TaxID=118154 RepID=A0A9Q1EXZ2_SYNKA|nr:hypothetical protein SKAU_G00285770 [Synaphobranchus kaupii]
MFGRCDKNQVPTSEKGGKAVPKSYGSLCGGYQDSLQDHPDDTAPAEHHSVWRQDYFTSQPTKEDAGTGHPGETGLPDSNTMVKLAGNALNRLHTCMQILEEHYLENLGHLTKKLENIHLSNGPEAFQEASRWAKKKFGRRLHLTTLDIAEKTFTPILTPRSTTSAVSTNNRFSVLADTPPPPPTTGRTTVTPPQDQYQREWPALRQTYPPGSPAPRRNAERTVLPQEALHHQRNRTSGGIAGHHRDWEPVPLPQQPPRTTRDRYNSGSTPGQQQTY